MKYAEALTKLIDDRYAAFVRASQGLGAEFQSTRDEFVTDNENITISANVIGALRHDFLWQAEDVEYGTFDNCREYGLTVSVVDWTFCVYEHRNSDEIHIEGCPTHLVQAYGPGPYGGKDKYDTLARFDWRKYHEAMKALEEMITLVRTVPGTSRATLKAVAG